MDRTCKQEGFWRAEVKAWEHARFDEIKKRPETLGEDYVQYLDKIASYDSGNTKNYAIITLNFPSDILNFYKIEELQELVDKVTEKKWVKDFIYNWEFYHKDGSWSHPHVHMLVSKANKSKSEIIREVFNTCNRVIHDSAKIDCKLIPVKDFEKAKNYVKKNREFDVKYREKLYLKNNYVSCCEMD